MNKICAFGEILLRIVPENKKKFISLPENAELSYGGSELNFCVNLSNLGIKTYFITALPCNSLGNSALITLDKFKINRNFIKITKKGRLGLYFIEEGIANRPSNIIYDRKKSSINKINFEEYNFHDMFSKTNHYHITGITCGLSKKAMYTTLRSVRLAKEMGLTVSCGLNYRKKLWKYKIDNEPVNKEKIMTDIAAYCDYLFGNESDLLNFFKIEAQLPENTKNEEILIYYQNILLKFSKIFPHIKVIALSIRKSINTSSNFIGGVAYKRETNQFFFSPNVFNRYKPYHIFPVYDRIGTGDAFSSGFIYGLNKYNKIQQALDFGTACSVLKHSYKGNLNYAVPGEVMSLMNDKKRKENKIAYD